MLSVTIGVLLAIQQSFGGKICSYLGVEGIGYPVNTCMYQAEADPDDPSQYFEFAFEFICDATNTITANYFENATQCTGSSTLEMDGYYCAESPDVTGQECKCIGRGRACDTFNIEMASDSNCQTEENTDQLISIVVNECIPTGFGGSEYFTCDEAILTMETYTDCEDCDCYGEQATFDYTYLNEEYCFNITCEMGVRKRAQCDTGSRGSMNHGMKQKQHNSDDEDDNIALDILSLHVRNHHLFVQNLIGAQDPSIIHINLPFSDKLNKWDIFGNDAIWKEQPLLITVASAIIILSIISIILYCRRNSQYSKV